MFISSQTLNSTNQHNQIHLLLYSSHPLLNISFYRFRPIETEADMQRTQAKPRGLGNAPTNSIQQELITWMNSFCIGDVENKVEVTTKIKAKKVSINPVEHSIISHSVSNESLHELQVLQYPSHVIVWSSSSMHFAYIFTHYIYMSVCIVYMYTNTSVYIYIYVYIFINNKSL